MGYWIKEDWEGPGWHNPPPKKNPHPYGAQRIYHRANLLCVFPCPACLRLHFLQYLTNALEGKSLID